MGTMNRRSFAGTLAGAAVGASLFGLSRAAEREAPLCFSTLGCPEWDWNMILEQAQRLSFRGIELRGIQGRMELPELPEFAGSAWKKSLEDVKAHELKIVNLGASTAFHEPDADKRARGLESAKRFVDLAHNLQAPYIRVFGDRYVEGEPREATRDRIVTGLQELARHAQGSGVTALIESHGDFNKSPDLLAILTAVNREEVALLWDAHHTYAFGHESPEETWNKLGAYVRHVHLKDSRPEGEAVRYVLTGQGTVPVKETAETLAKGGYKGYYSFEWEKGWHAELEEPEVAFPHFVQEMREYLGAGR